MEFKATDDAKADLAGMDGQLRKFFASHFRKLMAMPPRRHMRLGLPFFVEDVTKKARFVYDFEGEMMIILRCFATHKEYEKWYMHFK